MADFWRGRRVLVTGHAGFVGSNLGAELLDRGALPMGYDPVLYSPSLKVLGVDCARVAGDVADLRLLMGTMHDFQPEVIFHLAGQGHIKDSQEAPFAAFHLNAMGTVAVLEAVRREAPHYAVVVCASSNHVYLGGLRGSDARYNEHDDLDAVDAYGSSKIAADLAVRCYRESYGLRAAALRHVNSYGPADPHESHLVTGAILACLDGKRPTLRSDGSALKGYLHVCDVVEAYLLVAERVDTLPCHAVNVADREAEASAEAVARLVMRAAGMAGDPEVLGEDLSQSGYEERLDATILRGLGWTPYHGLAGGIAATYRWYRQHGGRAWLAS
mgnify:CR=1 FL=1